MKIKVFIKIKILIEKYIPGIEYAVEGWVDDKKFILVRSQKKRSKPQNYLI